MLAAQAMGADFAYIGSAFIATDEARAADAYKQCIVEGSSDDIVYSSLFTGVHGNYLKPLDPQRRPRPRQPARERPEQDELRRRRRLEGKAWKDIWGCGQGIGAVKQVVPARELVARLAREYEERAARALLRLHAAVTLARLWSHRVVGECYSPAMT